MSEISKLIATFLIWMSFTIVMTSGTSPLNSSDLSGGSAVLAIVFLAIAAGGSTLGIWVGTAKASREQSDGKAKRTRSRVGQFMDSLSDDEVAELRARLMVEEDESVPLESLLSQRERRQ